MNNYYIYQPEKDANDLYNAMKGLGTDEDKIIKIIANKTNQQRQQIMSYFKTAFGKDLKQELKDELSGKFEKASLALFETPVNYDAKELNRAIKGAGTNEDTLIEIIGTRAPKILKEIKAAYLSLYGRSLEEDIKDETSGDFQNLLISLLQCNRSEVIIPNNDQCMKDAKDLYNAGEGTWGTDESVFNKLFSSRSPNELGVIARLYHQLCGKTLLESIDNEFSGDLQKLLKTIIQAMVNAPAYYASRINEAMKGLGTNDEVLIRILVSRDEIDMPEIKNAYRSMYGRDMIEDIKDDTSGDYKNLLVELASH